MNGGEEGVVGRVQWEEKKMGTRATRATHHYRSRIFPTRLCAGRFNLYARLGILFNAVDDTTFQQKSTAALPHTVALRPNEFIHSIQRKSERKKMKGEHSHCIWGLVVRYIHYTWIPFPNRGTSGVSGTRKRKIYLRGIHIPNRYKCKCLNC